MTAPDPWAVPLSVTEPQLVDAAVQTLRLRHPEWLPQETSTEVMLLEALAVIAGQTGYAVTQTPAVVLGQLLTLYGVPRQAGQPATGQIKIQGATSMGTDRTITAGTRLRIAATDGTSFDLTVDADVTVPASTQQGWVTVTATEPGAAPNGTPAGTAVQLVDGATWVETVTLSEALAGGLNMETDAAWFARGAAALRRRSTALVLPGQFADAALDTQGITRAAAINLWDGSSATPGEDLGHVTVVATDVQGQPLDTDVKAAALNDLQRQALAALTIHIADPTYRAGTLTWSVISTPGADAATIRAAVHDAVDTYLSPATWPLGDEPNNFRLATIIADVPGVAVVTGCTWAWTDSAPNPTDVQLVGTVTYADETVSTP